MYFTLLHGTMCVLCYHFMLNEKLVFPSTAAGSVAALLQQNLYILSDTVEQYT